MRAGVVTRGGGLVKRIAMFREGGYSTAHSAFYTSRLSNKCSFPLQLSCQSVDSYAW